MKSRKTMPSAMIISVWNKVFWKDWIEYENVKDYCIQCI